MEAGRARTYLDQRSTPLRANFCLPVLEGAVQSPTTSCWHPRSLVPDQGCRGATAHGPRALSRGGCQPLNGASFSSKITESIDPLRRHGGGRGLTLAEFTPADCALWDPSVFHFGESGYAPSPERSVSNIPSWSLGPWMPSQTVSQS